MRKAGAEKKGSRIGRADLLNQLCHAAGFNRTDSRSQYLSKGDVLQLIAAFTAAQQKQGVNEGSV